MAPSIRDNKKSRGRPKTTGIGTLVGIRMHDDELAEIDDWRARQEDQPSRPEAIRRLYRHGLEAEHSKSAKRKIRRA